MVESMEPVLQAIVDHCPVPEVDRDGSLQLQISALDYNTFQGVIGVGRIRRGTLKRNQQVSVVDREGGTRNGKVLQILGYLGLERIEQETAAAGDIVCITGLDPLSISDTICTTDAPEALPPLTVDEPTVSMTFQVNDSPFAGRDGKYVTSRNIKERLERELIHNVALRVEPGDSPDKFKVSGRGELHLSVLIEGMRREGFELGVSRPEVIIKEIDGKRQEPFEYVVIDIEDQHQGAVMEALGLRKGEMKNMEPDGQGRLRLEYIIAARGLIGFRSQFLTMTSGTGIMSHVFDHYGPLKEGDIGSRNNGVLVSMTDGATTAYSLFNLQDRGRLIVGAGVDVYEGMLLGIHSRDNDLPVNPVKGKQLTNVRASGTDEALTLSPPVKMTLESALEFIDDDELVEVTPNHIRLRKKLLKEADRKRAGRSKAAS
jgi:GTP-binding protein